MAKIYRYQDLDGVHDITRESILDIYYKYWSNQMKKVGKEDQISEEACIEDFLIAHYGWEIKNE